MRFLMQPMSFNFYDFSLSLSPMLLLLGLPWLTGTGSSHPEGDNSYRGEYLCTGPLCKLICFHKGLQEPKAPQANKIWLRGWNSGLLR